MLPALVVSPLSRLDRAEPLERIGENVIAAETRVLGHDIEAKLEGPVCRQVVAGPRNHTRHPRTERSRDPHEGLLPERIPFGSSEPPREDPNRGGEPDDGQSLGPWHIWPAAANFNAGGNGPRTCRSVSVALD